MLQPITEAAILDTTPRTLADTLDTLAQGLLDRDREVAGVLIAARAPAGHRLESLCRQGKPGQPRPRLAAAPPGAEGTNMSAALAHMAARVASNPRFLAHRLAAFQRRQGLTDALLALVLAMPIENLDRLRLCGLPRQNRWREDVGRIAEAVEADSVRLAEVLHEAEGMADA